MHLPAGLLAGLGEGFEEIVAVHVIQENFSPPVPPAHDVVQGTGILNAQLARHVNQVAEWPSD